jgi:hypothetical protein
VLEDQAAAALEAAVLLLGGGHASVVVEGCLEVAESLTGGLLAPLRDLDRVEVLRAALAAGELDRRPARLGRSQQSCSSPRRAWRGADRPRACLQ